MDWHCGRYRLDLDKNPLLMGILNVTPDSFSDGYARLDDALAQADSLVRGGAHIIDVGGESTRPGSDSVSTDVELERVIPVIEGLTRLHDLPVSIDTQKPVVATAAIAAGASIINGVSGSLDYVEMTPVLANCDAGFVAMHMLDRPKTMQRKPNYTDVVAEVGDALAAVGAYLADKGIASDRLLYDPGIGFGKTLAHNLTLLSGTRPLARRLGRPLLMGLSRKSWLTHLLGTDRGDLVALDAYSALASTRLPHPEVAVHRVHNVALLNSCLVLADQIQPLP